MSDATHPFDSMPDTPAQRALEGETQELLSELYAKWFPLYRPGADGPLARSSMDQAIGSTVGTLMLRLADMGISTSIVECPHLPEAKAHGDGAILLARITGYLLREAPRSIRARLVQHLVAEMMSCAGVVEPPTPAPTREPVAAPQDLPLTPIRTSACNMTLVAEGCYDLPACRGEDFIATYWQLNDESKAAIAAGLPIKLSIIGHSHPPVRLEVDAL